ncbi:hypothetical protein IQ266_21960 [filamentous cyanobacterium LEGE 11480]|uniref:Uncharacterized protein n=1 Tax=Romeriopsis navalis LEGE 11480 TaxID=2777977 RepID=A0A928VRF7_9CYAN|nr:hypothetical protein [Romeriopsis navalis]MBE9032408.1 hypothetical protein [Romeriopsis navalis LEGE 11480]
MQSPRQVAFTPERLAQLKLLSEQLLADDVLPHKVSLPDVVEYLHPTITALRERSYSWNEIHALLADQLKTFGFPEVSVSRLRNAFYRASDRIIPRQARRQIAKRLQAVEVSQRQPLTPSIPNRDPSISNSTSEVTEPIPPSSAVSPINTPEVSVQLAPSIASPLAPEPQSELLLAPAPESEIVWTRATLEAALVIPTPTDHAAVALFLAALLQIKSTDPKRWSRLFSQAMTAGVNVTGTIVVPVATRHALFNKY